VSSGVRCTDEIVPGLEGGPERIAGRCEQYLVSLPSRMGRLAGTLAGWCGRVSVESVPDGTVVPTVPGVRSAGTAGSVTIVPCTPDYATVTIAP